MCVGVAHKGVQNKSNQTQKVVSLPLADRVKSHPALTPNHGALTLHQKNIKPEPRTRNSAAARVGRLSATWEGAASQGASQVQVRGSQVATLTQQAEALRKQNAALQRSQKE